MTTAASRRLGSQRSYRWVPAIVAMGLTAICVLLLATQPVHSFYGRVPFRDSGVFQYVGWRMARGDVPYVDVWDHKGPLLYYVNMLGVGIGDRSPALLGWIEIAALVGTVVILVGSLRGLFGWLPALLSASAFLLFVSQHLEGGNLTEAYALPFQAGAFAIAAWALRGHPIVLAAPILGAAAGALTMLRPNLVGAPLALLLYLLVQQDARKSRTAILAIAALSAATIILVLMVPIVLAGGLRDFFDQLIVYNAVYSQVPWLHRLYSIGVAVSQLTRFSLYWIALVALALLAVPSSGKPRHPPGTDDGTGPRRVAWGALFVLVVEGTLLSVSGRAYLHYLLPLAVPFAVLAAFGLWNYLQLLGNPLRQSLGAIALVTVVVVPNLGGHLTTFRDLLRRPQIEMNDPGSSVNIIVSETEPHDLVLMWGAEAWVNFVSRRAAPTRYVYQYPLVTPGYVDATRIDEFLSDLAHRPPGIIFDTHNSLVGSLQRCDRTHRGEESICYLRNRIAAFVEEQYRHAGVTDEGWEIYVRPR